VEGVVQDQNDALLHLMLDHSEERHNSLKSILRPINNKSGPHTTRRWSLRNFKS